VGQVYAAEIGTNDFRISDVGVDGAAATDAAWSAVAYNSTHNEFLVVWSGDETNNEFEIYGQRINAVTGTEVGNNDFRISDMVDDADFPAVVYNSTADEYLVVWQGDERAGGQTEWEIYGQRIYGDRSLGDEVGNNDFRISDMGPDGDGSYDAQAPSLAYNSTNNEYLVVWEGDDNTAPLVDNELEIFGQRLSATGVEVGNNDFRLSDMGTNGVTSQDAQSPDVAYNSTNNEYLVIWQGDERAGGQTEWEIYGQRIYGDRTSGDEVGNNDFRLSDMGPDGNGSYDGIRPAVAYNSSSNEYLVAWEGDDNTAPFVNDEYEIFVQRVYGNRASGDELGTNDLRISDMGPSGNNAYDASGPDITYNSGSDEYLVVWDGDDNIAPLVDGEIEAFGQRLDTSASEIGSNDFRISDVGVNGDTARGAANVAVAFNSTSNTYLSTWEGDEITDNEFEIYGQLLNYVPPIVLNVNSVADTGDGVLSEGEFTFANITQLIVSFSEPVSNAANTGAYLLFDDGGDGFDTVDCAGGIAGNDGAITINSAVYNSATAITTLNVNGGVALPGASYRLLVCSTGATPIQDSDTNTLDGNGDGTAGDDFARNFSVGLPPTISKAFAPATVGVNGNSTLTFTITNPNPVGLTGLNFTDTLPTGVVVRTPLTTGGTCGAIAWTAGTVAGGSQADLQSATIGASMSCSVAIDVTATSAGAKNNISGNVGSTETGAGTDNATATLTVLLHPTISKVFSGVDTGLPPNIGDPTIPLNGVSTLTFTITNPNVGASLSGLNFTDTLPAGLQLANPVNQGGTCPAPVFAPALAPGGTQVNLVGSGALGSTSACTITVDVQGTTTGVKANVTGTINSAETGVGTSTAADSLLVLNYPTITKTIAPDPIEIGATTTITFTITNPNATSGLSGLNFTDTLPASMTIATPPNQGGTCVAPVFTPALAGGGTAINLTGSGTLAASSSCTITVDVVATPDASYTNTTGVIGSSQTGSGTDTGTDTVIVRSYPTISKTFSPHTIAPGGVSTLTFTITNPNTTTYTLSGLNFTDALPASVVIATPPNQGGTCPMPTFVPALAGGGTDINLTGSGIIGLSSACTIAVDVTSGVSGTHTNTSGVVGSTETGASTNSATSTLTVGAPPWVVSAIPTGNVTVGPIQLIITFNQDVNDAGGGANPNDVTNPANYMLFQTGGDLTYETVDCAGGVAGTDVARLVGPVSYNAGTFTSRVTVNGGTPLPIGDYRVHVCGTTSIENLIGIPLGGGVDYVFNFSVIRAARALPDTGFTPGVITELPLQPSEKAYADHHNLSLDIPSLGVKIPIVGVPLVVGGWDTSWLGDKAGYLEGTAFPTWAGNTGITAHVWDADNNPGPFTKLKELRFGDVVKIHAWGQVYTYEVRYNYLTQPGNMHSLRHEEFDWVTLLTCERYNERFDTYSFRRVVRAVLVDVSP
jgi:LPXTG-site transpeptidase (sortase) family protein